MTGGSNNRVSLAALIAVRPGCRPRLIYRVHHGRRSRDDQRKGFRRMQYRPGFLDGFLTGTRLDLTPSRNSRY